MLPARSRDCCECRDRCMHVPPRSGPVGDTVLLRHRRSEMSRRLHRARRHPVPAAGCALAGWTHLTMRCRTARVRDGPLRRARDVGLHRRNRIASIDRGQLAGAERDGRQHHARDHADGSDRIPAPSTRATGRPEPSSTRRSTTRLSITPPTGRSLSLSSISISGRDVERHRNRPPPRSPPARRRLRADLQATSTDRGSSTPSLSVSGHAGAVRNPDLRLWRDVDRRHDARAELC